MRLTMKERRRLAEAMAGRYRKARKKDKRTILNEFVEATGFARSYAALVLRNQGRVVEVEKKLRVRGDLGERLRLRRPGRGPTYDEATVKALVQVWRLMDYICGKRLATRSQPSFDPESNSARSRAVAPFPRPKQIGATPFWSHFSPRHRIARRQKI